MSGLYEEPRIRCSAIRDPACGEWMVLPYPVLPLFGTNDYSYDPSPGQTGIDPLRWPPETSTAAIGCPHCGTIAHYESFDVAWFPAPYREYGRYAANTSCFCVETECAIRSCQVRVRFYTVLGGKIPTESAIIPQVRTLPFDGTWSNGHALRTIPANRYRATRVLGPIPSKGLPHAVD